MDIREWIHKNTMPAAGILAGVMVLVIIALLFLLGAFDGDKYKTSDKLYYYDMKTGKLFAADKDLIPPIKAPSGGEGVVADVYDCDECDGEDQYIALLKKYSPKARKAVEKGLPPDPNGELVRLPIENSKWVPADSKQGQKLRLKAAANVRDFCGEKKPKACFPK